MFISRGRQGGKSHFSLRILRYYPAVARGGGKRCRQGVPASPHPSGQGASSQQAASLPGSGSPCPPCRRPPCCRQEGTGWAGGRCAAHAAPRGYGQAEFKTFCSFDVNSRGSLRTEIRPAPPSRRHPPSPGLPSPGPPATSRVPALIPAAPHFLGLCFLFPLLQEESSCAQGCGPRHTPAEALAGVGM